MGSLAGVWGYGRSSDLRLQWRELTDRDTQCTDGDACRHHSGADGGDADYSAANHDRYAEPDTGYADRSGRVADRSGTISV